MGDVIAYVIVAAMLLWSIRVVLRRFMPKTMFHVQQVLAVQAGKAGLPRLQQWLQPSLLQSGCDSGCSSCGTRQSPCASEVDSQQEQQPVQWRPAAKK